MTLTASIVISREAHKMIDKLLIEENRLLKRTEHSSTILINCDHDVSSN